MEPVLPLSPYSAECVEEEFSEVGLPIYGFLGRWLRGSAGGIMLVMEREISCCS